MTGRQTLQAYQAANKDRTIAKLKSAMHAMQAEIREHGYYPHNHGTLTRKEVCLRAGVGGSTLKNKTHAATAGLVDRWIERMGRSVPIGKKPTNDEKAARISSLTDQIEQIANHCNRYKLECELLEERNAELQEEAALLQLEHAHMKREIAALKAQLQAVNAATPKVVPIRVPDAAALE